jgi:hypothetical protein
METLKKHSENIWKSRRQGIKENNYKNKSIVLVNSSKFTKNFNHRIGAKIYTLEKCFISGT